jgi:hypothetical protein
MDPVGHVLKTADGHRGLGVETGSVVVNLEGNRAFQPVGPKRNDDACSGRVLHCVRHGLEGDEVERRLQFGLKTAPVHSGFDLDPHDCG